MKEILHCDINKERDQILLFHIVLIVDKLN